MTQPPRLRDTNPNFSRVVSALRTREPDPDLVAKVLALPDRPAPSDAGSAGASGSSSLARWLVVGATTLTLVGLGWAVREGTTKRTPTATVVAEAPARNTVESATENTSAPTISVDDLPKVAEAPPSPSMRTQPIAAAAPKATATASAFAASSFHEELVLVEAARSALSRGDGEGCLRILDRYAERFRGGVLSSEAEITRIEALANIGQPDRARSLADRFLANNAASPYAERVRSLRDKLPSREPAPPNTTAGDEGGR